MKMMKQRIYWPRRWHASRAAPWPRCRRPRRTAWARTPDAGGRGKEGNKAGTIPAWGGGLTKAPAGFDGKNGYCRPAARAKAAQYSITAASHGPVTKTCWRRGRWKC